MGNTMKYGYKDGLKGVEWDVNVSDDVLEVKILGVNHWKDIVSCLYAWPKTKSKLVSGLSKYHRKWYAMALEVYWSLHFDEITEVIIKGHSMGGAIGVIVGQIINQEVGVNVVVYSINAPKAGDKKASTYNEESYKHIAMYDKGDVIRFLPFFYPRYSNRKCYAHTIGVGKAHNNMPDVWRD